MIEQLAPRLAARILRDRAARRRGGIPYTTWWLTPARWSTMQHRLQVKWARQRLRRRPVWTNRACRVCDSRIGIDVAFYEHRCRPCYLRRYPQLRFLGQR